MKEKNKKILVDIMIVSFFIIYAAFTGYILGISSSFEKICESNFGNFSVIPTHVEDLAIYQCTINSTVF